jgi:Fe-S-cluster containining protein
MVKHLSVSADKLIRLYAPSDFNDDDSDNDWISLSYGKRKIGLRKKRDGTCMFLSEKRQCTAYEARPMSCRVFPIDIVLDEENNIIDLDLSDVIRDKFIKCNHYSGKPQSFNSFRIKAVQSRDETVSYWKKIKQWNDQPEKGGKNDFLAFLGVETSH